VVRIRKETRNKLKSDVDYALKGNAKMIERLYSVAHALDRLLMEKMVPCVGVVAQLCETFTQLAPLEVELFDKTPLPVNTVLQQPPQLQFPFSQHASPATSMWRENLRQVLKLPRCHAPEVLLSEVMKAKDQLDKLKSFEHFEQTLIKDKLTAISDKNSINNSVAIEGFEKRDAERTAQEKAMAVKQHELCNEVEKGIQAASRVSALADDWWNQPAQFVVPWVLVENRSMQQWLQEWRSLCAQLDPQ